MNFPDPVFPILRLPALLAVLLLLNACVSQSPQTPEPHSEAARAAEQKPAPVPTAPSASDDWDNYRQVLGAIEQWQVQGKLGIRLPDNSGSVYFNWKQWPAEFAIHLNGPLGQGATWVRGNERQVSLEQAGQAPMSAASPEDLMYNALGWWLPVGELYYWIRGIPAPDAPVQSLQRHTDGTLLSLEQRGWQMSYSRHEDVEGWSLPTRLTASNRDIRLTFIIKSWQLH